MNIFENEQKNMFFFCMHAWCLKFPRMKVIFVVELLAGICFWFVWFDLWSAFIILSCYLAIFFTAFLSSSSYLEHCFETSHFISFNLFHIPLIYTDLELVMYTFSITNKASVYSA